MKVYISGKITGNINYVNQFKKAEESLTLAGHTVLNPIKNLGFSYKDYIDMGLCELMKCDAIYLLEGWKESEGAYLEYTYANTVGMKVFFGR